MDFVKTSTGVFHLSNSLWQGEMSFCKTFISYGSVMNKKYQSVCMEDLTLESSFDLHIWTY